MLQAQTIINLLTVFLVINYDSENFLKWRLSSHMLPNNYCFSFKKNNFVRYLLTAFLKSALKGLMRQAQKTSLLCSWDGVWLFSDVCLGLLAHQLEMWSMQGMHQGCSALLGGAMQWCCWHRAVRHRAGEQLHPVLPSDSS